MATLLSREIKLFPILRVYFYNFGVRLAEYNHIEVSKHSDTMVVNGKVQPEPVE